MGLGSGTKESREGSLDKKDRARVETKKRKRHSRALTDRTPKLAWLLKPGLGRAQREWKRHERRGDRKIKTKKAMEKIREIRYTTRAHNLISQKKSNCFLAIVLVKGRLSLHLLRRGCVQARSSFYYCSYAFSKIQRYASPVGVATRSHHRLSFVHTPHFRTDRYFLLGV